MKRMRLITLLLLMSCIVFAKGENNNEVYKGKWISFQQTQSLPNSWYIYRKDIKLQSIPETLIAKIAVDSKYWLWVNDELVVFEGGLKRGPARNSTYYDEVDIASYLSEGDNTIAILVWFFGKNGFSHVNSGYAGLWFEAIGKNVEIISDNSWEGMVYSAYQDTEAPFPNFRLPESNIRFDAREEIEGWNKKSFTGNLRHVSKIDALEDIPIGSFVKRPIPLWKDSGLSDYLSVGKSAKGDTLFCKLPYNCHVTPYFKIKSPAGKIIKMQTDNYYGGSSPNVRGEYITKEGIQEYESPGWMNGHEMWYVIPDNVEVLELKYRETGYNVEFVKPFSCDIPFYNELWKRSARTLYVTMRDTYMDCPDRERSQWWGDEVNELGEAFYALTPPSHALALKGIYELMNWQRADGVIFSPAPAGNWNSELPLQMLASVGWYGFYTQYYYSGDSSFVPVIYDRLNRYLHEVWKVDHNGLVIERPGDWTWADWGTNVDMGVLTNCWYYLALKAEREFAVQSGKQDDAEKILGMMKGIELNFDKKFWTGKAYRSPGYTGATDDRSQAMAVVSGLASKDKYPAIFEALKTEFHASPYMEKYVLESLFLMNQADYALERMKQRYENMLSYDYSTLFEGWGIGADGFGGGTINHAWSGGPLTLLSQKVCGLDATSPGFKTFKVEPQMGFLKEASTNVMSVNGEINVSVSKKGRKMVIKVNVPSGVKGEIVFPAGEPVIIGAGKHTIERKL
jgi:hypothetical protein